MNFTHRTTRNIGYIEAGTPIRVLMFRGWMDFGYVLDHLGDSSHISYKEEGGGAVSMTDASVAATCLVQDGDYLITDGTLFWATGFDTGFEPLPAQKGIEFPFEKEAPQGIVILDIEADNEFVLGVWDYDHNGGCLQVDSEFLHKLADFIKENIPEPAPIEGHMFIWGTSKNGTREPLARDGELWYDSDNVGYTTREVNELYTDLEVIR